MTGTITGIANKPEPNGDYVVEIALPDGTGTLASISPAVARAIVAILQPSIVEDAAQRAQNMKLPYVEVNDVGSVQGPERSELMIGTNQMGRMVLHMSDTLLVACHQVIDRLIIKRESPKSSH